MADPPAAVKKQPPALPPGPPGTRATAPFTRGAKSVSVGRMTPAAYLATHTAELLALLRRLVAVPTVNPPGHDYDGLSALLVRELAARGLRARRFRVPAALCRQHLPAALRDQPRFNVLGTWHVPGATKTIHFNAHYDVVPVSGTWRHGDPFGGAVERGWIYGRGTADMKGAIASFLLALDALRATGTPPRAQVEVSFTADEETDSALGTEWLVRHAPLHADYAVVMEGGEGPRVCCGHNGVVWLEVHVHGRAAHGSRPEMGINAFEKMAALVGALEEYKRELAARRFTTPEGVVMQPTINVGGVFQQGPGGKINTVPDSASFSIDRRVLADESLAEAERELRAFLAAAARRIPHCRLSIEKNTESHPCFTPPTDPFFQAMAGCVARVRRQPARFSVTSGFTDMHFFAHHRKIPTLGYGPGGQREHAVDERARVRDLVHAARIYADLLATFAG